jgi:CheY-like chemotaxis protein
MNTLARILLVEDNPNDEEMTLEAFAECRLANEVVVVRDGQEALDYLLHQGDYTDRQCGSPALILLDLKLPRVSGMEVLRRIKGNPELRTIPVVIMTSSREERDVEEGYELGVNAYVVKPVDFPSFVEAVKDLGVFWALINHPPLGSVSRSV